MTAPDVTTRPLGASRSGPSSWSFLVWAPNARNVSVRLNENGSPRDEELAAHADGYFCADVDGIEGAPTYRFVLDGSEPIADPASRWQPEGVHGPSRGVDPSSFAWTDTDFVPPPLEATVLYELHVGTFTAAGTFDAAVEHLDELVDVGATAVEVMPVGAFPGERNWGYDGAFPFAVQDSYGGPAGLARFVDACHARGLAVYLDVIYNHLGPEGTVHDGYGPYFTDVYETPWGRAMNVSESGSDEVRRYFSENALMWLRDFHLDGLRLDAIHGIVDPTATPFLAELTDAIATLSESVDRPLVLIAESADNNPRVTTGTDGGGLGFDAQWSDDLHHALHAVLTGERDGYYQDFAAGLELLAAAFNRGFAYVGQHSAFRGRRHGADPSPARPQRFVVFAQNHDQIGNRAGAERLTTLLEPDQVTLASAVVLLSPFVPLLFMGEEYAETAPFPYFVDHSDPALLEAVRVGRAAEFGRDADSYDPADEKTFAAAVLDRTRRDHPEGAASLALHRALIAARRVHPILTTPDAVTTATVHDSVLLVRRAGEVDESLAVFNFAAEPAHLTIDSDFHSGPELASAVASVENGLLGLPPYGFALFVSEPSVSNEDGA